MQKLLICLLCFTLIGCSTVPISDTHSGNQKICDMKFKKVVILGEVVDAKTAFDFANSYRAAVWYREAGPRRTVRPGHAMRELIAELEGINAKGNEWEFIIPDIGERYFFITLKSMDKDSLSNISGTVYLAHSSENKLIEDELKRVSGGKFSVLYGK